MTNITAKNEFRLQLIPDDDLVLRLGRLRKLMADDGMDSMLVGDNANKFYLTGRIFDGFIYLTPDGRTVYLVRRPSDLRGDGVLYIHKPENILDVLAQAGIPAPKHPGLELSLTAYAVIQRLAKALHVTNFVNADPTLMQARAVKTPVEIDMIARCGVKHVFTYREIPHLYREGMSDIELQIEIERATRLQGGMGQLRVTGNDMEINMGSVLAGPNADTPSPYDFALGGAGASPALPIGANGTILRPDMAVMVDTNGDFNGYMTDMTRTYSIGTLPDDVLAAHRLSVSICDTLQNMARPGAACRDLYNAAMDMVNKAGLDKSFMGHRSQAAFVGHGVGITINELPVIAPRSRDILQAGNVIAIEPKFVMSPYGAVGIENTYVVTADGPARCLTPAPVQILDLSE